MGIVKKTLTCIACIFGSMVATTFLMVVAVVIMHHPLEEQSAALDWARWSVGIVGAMLGLAVFIRDVRRRRKTMQPEQPDGAVTQESAQGTDS
jgi:TRAP-type C4-dicarboxylate transport system permease small subunit